jgi:hypothetical protein
MKLDCTSQSLSESTLPFVGLQHTQQLQVGFQLYVFVSKYTVLEKWLLRLWGVEFKMSWSNTSGQLSFA